MENVQLSDLYTGQFLDLQNWKLSEWVPVVFPWLFPNFHYCNHSEIRKYLKCQLIWKKYFLLHFAHALYLSTPGHVEIDKAIINNTPVSN